MPQTAGPRRGRRAGGGRTWQVVSVRRKNATTVRLDQRGLCKHTHVASPHWDGPDVMRRQEQASLLPHSQPLSRK